MIHVCDAMMGSGKTTACINMMNAHPEKRYIFITPYLDEAARIKNACPTLDFIEPSSGVEQYGFTKTGHAYALVQRGCNIATTHQAFLYYTDELLAEIEKMGYTLVIDESVNVLESAEITDSDLDAAVGGGFLVQEGDTYKYTGKPYHHRARMAPLYRIAESRDLVCVKKSGGLRYEMFYWVLPERLLTAFEEVYVLTYLFSGQTLYYFLTMNNIPFDYIGLKKEDGNYYFCEDTVYLPEYVRELKEKIHLVDDPKMNSVGDNQYAMSVHWYQTKYDGVDSLRKLVNSYFSYRCKEVPSNKKMWASFKVGKDVIKGRGYAKSHVPFNARATNDYRDRTHLAYTANVFMHVGEKMYYKNAGIEVDEDAYALSVLIQWIWRSAIRDGKDIYLYLPSKRMRTLLENWLDTMSNEGGVLDD